MKIGSSIIHLEQVTSTNDIAWQFQGVNGNNGLVVIASEQTTGRGRRGDRWISPHGLALYQSILLRPHPSVCRAVKLTIWAGVGVCCMLERVFALSPQLKWPNDVLVQKKKICGILVEQRQDWCVVGVGLNIAIPATVFESAGVYDAASISDFTNILIDRMCITERLLQDWNELYQSMLEDGGQFLLSQWNRYSGIIGSKVQLSFADQQYKGTVQAMGWEEILMDCEGMKRSFQLERINKLTPVD